MRQKYIYSHSFLEKDYIGPPFLEGFSIRIFNKIHWYLNCSYWPQNYTYKYELQKNIHGMYREVCLKMIFFYLFL